MYLFKFKQVLNACFFSLYEDQMHFICAGVKVFVVGKNWLVSYLPVVVGAE